MNLRQLIETRSLIVCVGSGGVGKTTCAASIGLAGARAGRRVLVLTIDPARRLANSLGLKEFGNTEVRIPLAEDVKGELWAMMLDAASTFDDVIRRVAKDDATREAIYRTLERFGMVTRTRGGEHISVTASAGVS